MISGRAWMVVGPLQCISTMAPLWWSVLMRPMISSGELRLLSQSKVSKDQRTICQPRSRRYVTESWRREP